MRQRAPEKCLDNFPSTHVLFLFFFAELVTEPKCGVLLFAPENNDGVDVDVDSTGATTVEDDNDAATTNLTATATFLVDQYGYPFSNLNNQTFFWLS